MRPFSIWRYILYTYIYTHLHKYVYIYIYTRTPIFDDILWDTIYSFYARRLIHSFTFFISSKSRLFQDEFQEWCFRTWKKLQFPCQPRQSMMESASGRPAKSGVDCPRLEREGWRGERNAEKHDQSQWFLQKSIHSGERPARTGGWSLR